MSESWAAKASSGLPSVGPESAGGPTPLKELSADTFSMPRELGQIQEAVKVPNSLKTVIHIQDAHCNYAAQRKISDILDYLTSEYGISVINCEGGAGDYDLAVFTDIPEKDIREKTSDYFVRAGIVNAAEFFAVNNPAKANLWGVEDADLYLKNLKIYKESLFFKDEVARYLRSIRYLLDNLKRHIYSPELMELDSQYMRYKENQISFKEYITYLIAAAQKRAINIKSFPDIYLLDQALKEEDRINFKKADNEKDEVVDKLKKILSKNELEELMLKVSEMKIERISQADFYAYLVKKCKSVNVDMKGYVELEKYIIYISIYSAIDRTKVTKEIDNLEDSVKEALYENDAQRELGVLSKNLILEKNMFDISLTRDDYTYYKKYRASFNVSNFTRFIDKWAPLYKMKAALDGKMAMLDVYREKIEAFYEYSLERDNAFVKNIRFTDHDRPNSIIITGGFHTENLRELFRNENISYISIMPKFTNEKGYESPYLKRLSGQRTALENVIDTAIPAVLNLQVVNTLSTALAIRVEGTAGLERFRLAVLIMAAIERGQKFIFKVDRRAYPEGNRPQEDKVIIFSSGEGGNISSSVVSSNESGFTAFAAIANAALTAISANSFEFSVVPSRARAEITETPLETPPAKAQPLAPGPAPVIKPFAVISEGKLQLLPTEAATPAPPAPFVEPMYESAKSIIPEMVQSMRRDAPTYLLSPAISDEDIAPETSNNRTAEQILGKQGHEIHAKSYLANGENWQQDLNNLKKLLESTLKSFIPDAQNALTRMAIRIISDEKGERIQEVRNIIKTMLIKDYKLSEEEAKKIITKQIKFVPISILNVQHINASIDLFTDIGMMEIDRYLEGDYPRGELPVELKDRFLTLLKSSITNFNDIMKFVKTEEDIEGILNTIFRCSVVLQIKPVDWKSVDAWKKAQDAILKSL